jgi:membrane protein DedA with SNARE-associated domain
VVSRLLHPILNLHGWQAYVLVALLVFAEAAVMLGFVFPGETAVILGGVLASYQRVNIVGLILLIIFSAIAGDSVGYLIGQKWGRRLIETRPLRQRQKGIDRALEELNRRGALAVFLARFSAFLRAVVPGLSGMSAMPYRIFLPANAAGGVVWGTTFCLLGYFVGAKVEHASGIVSYVLLGIIAVVVVVLVVRRHRKGPTEFGEPEPYAGTPST